MTFAATRPAAADGDRDASGRVYVQTNAAAGNAVVVFERHADGGLTRDETVATGGIGTSTGLGDQGALAITADQRHLLAVNAGSDDVSLLEVDDEGLELADVQPVGSRPVSVAVHADLVYVLNQGADTIQALRITDEDRLVAVPHSTRPLSTPGANAAQIGFSPDGRLLPNNQAAACWLVVTSDGRFAYTANAGSSNVSQYTIGADGALSLVGDGANGITDPGPVDLDVSDGDGYLYVLNSRSGSISAFSVDPDDGALTPFAGVSGLGSGWVGLVAV